MNLEQQLEELQTLNHLIEEAKHKIAFRNKIWSQFDSLSDERKQKCKHDNEITERAIERLEERVRVKLFNMYLSASTVSQIQDECRDKFMSINEYYYDHENRYV